MMLGGPIPVRLPYSADESMLVTRRQNKLARDIDTINQQIRNNRLSRSEGANRIRFKQSEIDELQRYKSSKRVPTGRLSPPPQRQKVIQRGGKPANKYNPYAQDKVNNATGPNMFDGDDIQFERASPDKRHKTMTQSTSWTEDDRAGMTSSSNQRSSGNKPPQQTSNDGRNPRGLVEADYYSRFVHNFKIRNGKSPNVFMQDQMKKNASKGWNSNAPLQSKLQTSVVDKAKDQAQSVVDKAKSWWSSTKSSSKSDTVESVEPTKAPTDNPHGRSFGPTLSAGEKFVSGNKAKKYGDTYYGPSAPQFANKWEDWNAANGIAGFAGMPNFMTQQRARANRETTLMRKRAGSRIRLDKPTMTNATQMRSWETYAQPEEIAMIKAMLPKMTGLEKFPELTPEGNAMMIELVSIGSDPAKMQMVSNKLATDLMNKSGYFVKQYNVKIDPLGRKVKISEASSLAGGLSKTRNSMQRLLK